MIELDILQLSYWEHFKFAKDLALIYPPEHQKRKEVEAVMATLIEKINEIKSQNESSRYNIGK